MKLFPLSCFSLAVALGIAVDMRTISAAENLIPNGDLEQDTTLEAGQLPGGMTTSGQDEEYGHPLAKCYLSSEEKSSGKYSLCIERLDDPQGFSRLSILPEPILVEGGKRYYFSCKIKSTEPKARVLMYVSGNDKMVLAGGLPDSVTPTQGAIVAYDGVMLALDRNKAEDPDGFNKVEWTFTIPPEGVHLNIALDFSHNALGKAWFDDFELRALD